MELNVKRLIENAKNYSVKFYDSLSLYMVIFDGKIGALHSYSGEEIVHGLIEYQYDLELFYVDSGRLPDKVYSVFGNEGKLIITGANKIIFFPKAKLFAKHYHHSDTRYIFFDLNGVEQFKSPLGVIHSSDTPKVENGKHHIFSFMHSFSNNVQLFNGKGKIIYVLAKDFYDRDLVQTNERISALWSKEKDERVEHPFIQISPVQKIGQTKRAEIINIEGKLVRNNVCEWKMFPEQGAFILQDADDKFWETFSLTTGMRISDKKYVSIEVQNNELVGASYEPIHS